MFYLQQQGGTWENISEIRQRNTNNLWYPLYVEGKSYSQPLNKTPEGRFRTENQPVGRRKCRGLQRGGEIRVFLGDYMKSCVGNI